MGRVVLSKEDIKKLDNLINMFEKQKKKFEELKKEYQDGIIDFESPTDIILYDAYIVLGKLIKKLPDVEGSDIFQEYVNVVLNDLIGDFSKLEDWCTKKLDVKFIVDAVTNNFNDMIDLGHLIDELMQMYDISLENIIGDDIISKRYMFLSHLSSLVKNSELRNLASLITANMVFILNLWPELSKEEFKISIEGLDNIYNIVNFRERVREFVGKFPFLAKDDYDKLIRFSDVFEQIKNTNLNYFKELEERLKKQEYSDNDKNILSSFLLIGNAGHKYLESYIKNSSSIYNCNNMTGFLSRGFFLTSMINCDNNILLEDSYLISIYQMVKSLSLLIDLGVRDSGALDVFSVCSADVMAICEGEGKIEKDYYSITNDISREVQHLSIDEKIDYYLEYMAKYREEMIKENGDSLVNVLKARMEQLEVNGVTNVDSLEQGPKGRTGR